MSRPPARRRQRRLAELLKVEVSNLLLRHLKDARIAAITSITNVAVSPDLKHAKVYVSVLGEPREQEATLIALRHAAGHIQHELGKRLELRFTPQLRFLFDERIQEGDHVLDLINRLYPAEQPRQESSPDAETGSDAE